MVVTRRPRPHEAASEDATRRNQRSRIPGALTDAKRHQALGDGKRPTELGQVIANVQPSTMERLAGDTEGSPDAPS
jgi:hypothetical protein